MDTRTVVVPCYRCVEETAQRVFWMVLNESIHKRKLELKDIKRIDFEELLQLAINHNVRCV